MPKKKTLEDSMKDKFYKEIMRTRVDKKDTPDTVLTPKLKKKLRIEMDKARQAQ
jgi:hypothetical protein